MRINGRKFNYYITKKKILNFKKTYSSIECVKIFRKM